MTKDALMLELHQTIRAAILVILDFYIKAVHQTLVAEQR